MPEGDWPVLIGRWLALRGVETANGERYDLDIIDGAEIPLLLDLVRSDRSVYYDPKTRTICSGWNDPGS